MSVRNITTTSLVSLEDAITRALIGAGGALGNVRSARITDRRERAGDRGSGPGYQVDRIVAFAED